MSLADKLFGTYSERQIKKIKPLVDKIEAMAEKYAAMTDEELKNMTPALKERLSAGETLDDILPDAFATVREAATRVLGKRPFRVQLMGGIILHQGRIAEMKTGEGKTLVATMPAYLNALAGKGVHIVTVNDYLARRDSEEMGKVYGFLGLKTGIIVFGQSPAEKQEAYNKEHHIVPKTIYKEQRQLIKLTKVADSDETASYGKKSGKKQTTKELQTLARELERRMQEAAKALDFEAAAELRDQLILVKGQLGQKLVPKRKK